MGGALAIFLFLTVFPYLGIDWDTDRGKTAINTEKSKKMNLQKSQP